MNLRFIGIVIYFLNFYNNKKMYILILLFLGRVYFLKYKKNK